MARINWDKAGERFYEAGVDRGVLYPNVTGKGVPWNGLISISESPNGGESTSHYIDGIKYHNEKSTKEYSATITAFTYPDEFLEALGTFELTRGVYIDSQSEAAFGLVYRSMVGNDVDGVLHGYKIHLVYNAIADDSTIDRTSLSNTPEAINFSWLITTTPISVDGYRRSSHYILDSRDIGPNALEYLEGILYGTRTTNPRLPPISEIVDILENWHSLYPTNNFYREGGLFPGSSTLPSDETFPSVVEIHYVEDNTFPSLTTYPGGP